MQPKTEQEGWCLPDVIFRYQLVECSSFAGYRITDCCLLVLCVFILCPAAGDLYVTIGKNIGTVDAQTWCSKTSHDTEVENVKCISIVPGRSWGPTKDHSKWCVSRENDWTCFADLNRDQKRRGGALCINNKGVKNIFRSFIDCSRKRKHSP